MANKKDSVAGRKKASAKKTISPKKKNASSDKFKIDVRVNILHTIADAIYSTPAGKVREAVANAKDHNATDMIIVADRATKSLCIYDNGEGISKERFEEIFKNIGYGLLQTKEETKLSFFGLGLMSIFQLGKKIKIFTRSRDEKKMFIVEVDTHKIFSQENKDKSISFLEDCILPGEANESDRLKATAPLLNNNLDKVPFNDDSESFTEIIIEDIEPSDFHKICEDDFLLHLRQILPLRIEDGEPLLKRITGRKNAEIRELLKNKDYCKTINVYFGIQEDDTIEQLWKYFPSFRSDIEFPDDNVYVGISGNGDFGYYLFHTVAIDLYRELGKEEEKENGFWVRNQNFLIKKADFLERSGPGRKIRIIDEPLKGWVFGEIFLKDANTMLTVSRNDYLYDREEFTSFRDEIVDIVSPLNKELREIYDKRTRIVKGLIEPFTKIAEPDGSIKNAEKRLQKAIDLDIDETEFRRRMFQKLNDARSPNIEDDNYRIDLNLPSTMAPFKLGEDEEALVEIDPTLTEKNQDWQIAWDKINRRIITKISPKLFEPKEVTFLGKGFKVVYVAKKEADPGVSINTDEERIYINPFNEDLAHYSVSIFDVYISLQIALSLSDGDCRSLVKSALALLGASTTVSDKKKTPISEKYIKPLGDELRRAFDLNRPGV